jgi:hypothetical protein
LLYLLVDVVIQCGLERHQRVIREIWYQPARKQSGARDPRATARARSGVRRCRPAL